MDNEVRLIDANKLIKTLRELEWITDNPCDGDNVLEDIINNAPTVAQIGQTINAYTTGFNTGVETVKRPQGEWIITNPKHTNLARCSECNFFKDTNGWNFCPNCGADMRGVRE